MAMTALIVRGEAHSNDPLSAALERTTALNPRMNTVRLALGDRVPQLDDVQCMVRGAGAYAVTVSSADHVRHWDESMPLDARWQPFSKDHDILLTGTRAELPAQIGRFGHDMEDYVGYRTGPGMILAYSPFTPAFNASGQPTDSVPLTWLRGGLPISIHLGARFGDDETLMALCAELQAARPWFAKRPPIVLAATSPLAY